VNTFSLHMYVSMSYAGFTRRNTWFIFLRLRHRNTWISILHVWFWEVKDTPLTWGRIFSIHTYRWPILFVSVDFYFQASRSTCSTACSSSRRRPTPKRRFGRFCTSGIYLSVFVSVYWNLNLYLSISISFYLSIYQCIVLYLSISISIYLSVYLSI